MGMIGDFLSGRLRQEMKQRVDEVMRCGNEWNKTARELIDALNKLTDSIQKGSSDPAIPKQVVGTSKRLARETARLSSAFESLNRTMAVIVEKYG